MILKMEPVAELGLGMGVDGEVRLDVCLGEGRVGNMHGGAQRCRRQGGRPARQSQLRDRQEGEGECCAYI